MNDSLTSIQGRILTAKIILAIIVAKHFQQDLFNVQFHTKCVVLMKKLCNSKVYYLGGKACKEGNHRKYCRFKYERIGEAQPEMESLAVVAFICPSAPKAGSSTPSATRI